MFLELYNKSIMSFKIADELSDDDFRKGWRIRKYLKNSDIDYVKYIAKVQEDADKENNELPFEHQPKVYHYGPGVSTTKPHAKTLFTSCDGWRYYYDR
jgi:hypothetical protein